MVQPVPRLATADDLFAIPEERRFHEIVDGELVEKAMPAPAHGSAHAALVARVREPYHRKPGGRWPGGWWIVVEVEVELAPHEVYRPDLTGWRRDRLPELPATAPVRVRPDWVCEVLSPSTARTDLVKKMRGYHRAEVPHYWIADPDQGTLTVYRHTPEGYLVALTAERGDRVRAEPFADVELEIAALFGDEGE